MQLCLHYYIGMDDKWEKIETDYITTRIGMRPLAEKWGVPYSTVRKRAQRGAWTQKKAQYVTDKDADRLKAQREIDYQEYKSLLEAAGLLSSKLCGAVARLTDADIIKDKRGLKSLTGAMKDLAEIQGVKSDADKREQEARIKNLERQATMGDTQPEPVRVIIAGADDFCGK